LFIIPVLSITNFGNEKNRYDHMINHVNFFSAYIIMVYFYWTQNQGTSVSGSGVVKYHEMKWELNQKNEITIDFI